MRGFATDDNYNKLSAAEEDHRFQRHDVEDTATGDGVETEFG